MTLKNKIVSADEAVAIVRDGDTMCVSGFVGIGTGAPGSKLELFGGDMRINNAGTGYIYMGTGTNFFHFSGTHWYMLGAAPGGQFRFNTHLTPENDNAYQCGLGTNRFTLVFATSGVVNTSDERIKTPFEDMPTLFARAMQVQVGAFDMDLGANINEDGELVRTDQIARWLGVSAQTLRLLFPEFDNIVFGNEGKEVLGLVESKVGVIALGALQQYVTKTEARLAQLEGTA